ncbi:cytochrome bd-I ubiquinol oxidase subunit 2 apoprotein [Pseudoduganella flava]|uniref:Cytochrome bd-I ubiquinol oxidase subunit 2 apoprotein n=1 Tax=Pseudoduganella flava TaxID=871742 RepID=A0A562PZQ1_9BURK|nr:cytochrome d ubiquinol oxidase subunit II [Pseudoduganella flava]QGZ38528.1 cytochrome d ubiquinol oxidase subunit II [Pseudoduganella flava]TWI49915.1 cytochrome bd-I ubiquinol oxidase subunit 2 apoprotein [Pseudoduganella flava]
MGIDLAVIWAVIILFGVMMYVVMDGFDLGIGLLYPFFPAKAERDVMMNTVAPVWDGNETWLVLGGAGLLAAFPLAYSVVLSALALPLIAMLIGLVFRGVAFEFRFKANARERPFWDRAFTWGSFTATYFQGVALGAYLDGIPVRGRAFAGHPLDWIAPFPLFVGAGLVATYALLGSTWLVMKTDGPLQQRVRAIAGYLTWAVLGAIAIVSLWTPLTHPDVAARWFRFPNVVLFAPVPLLVGAVAWLMFRALKHGGDTMPFLCALALVFLGYTGLFISLWPNVIPSSVTLWQASAPPQSQGFALVGALAIIPVILMYTAWSYYVFRGKVRHGEGYH